MKLEEAFAPDSSVEVFFEECVPALFEERLDLFSEICETTIIVSVSYNDTGTRYTVAFSPEGCRVERGEMIDFPVVTIAGSHSDWEVVKRRALRIAEALESRARAYELEQTVTREFLDALERHDGKFLFELSSPELDDPVEIELILNDYQLPPGAPTLRLKASFELGERLARGEVDISQVDESVRLEGDVGLGLDIGGLLLDYFPELEP